MKLGPPRLLPIVIAAAAALLLFKGIGIVTEGGYTLLGPTPVVAEEAGGTSPPAGDATGGDLTAGGPGMTDQAPTLEDKAVTMDLPADAKPGADAKPADAGNGAAPDIGPAEVAAPADACPPTDAAAPADATAAPAAGPCVPDPGVNEHGDALPLIKDNATGTMVPLASVVTDNSSETAINERLSERRTELEQLEKELAMRSTLLDAAEKRIDERSAELKALEEKINKLVDDNKAAEQQQFVSLVAMYENMKPKDAATIFDQLDMPVLLGVAKAMNPRKMAPILARMDPMKAKALTDSIAAIDTPVDPTTAAASQDLTNLPQIVGQ